MDISTNDLLVNSAARQQSVETIEASDAVESDYIAEPDSGEGGAPTATIQPTGSATIGGAQGARLVGTRPPAAATQAEPTPESKPSPKANKELAELAESLDKDLNERAADGVGNDGRAAGKLGNEPKTSDRRKMVETAEKEIRTTEERAGTLREEIDKLVKDAAESYEEAGGTAEADEKLDEHLGRLQEMMADVEEVVSKHARDAYRLRTERALNLMTNAAYVTNLPDAARRVLEGKTSIRLAVADDSPGLADAAYDDAMKSIKIDRAMLDEIEQHMNDLAQRGIIDRNGNIKDKERFDQDAIGDQVIAATTLVGVHEVTHGGQDGRGAVESTYAEIDRLVSGGADRSAIAAAGADPELAAALAEDSAERFRVQKLEVQAYRNQELAELRAGKVKRTFVTIREDGSRLPDYQAAENVLALQRGDALPYGVAATPTPGAVTPGEELAVADTGALSALPGDDEQTGRRLPGQELPGRRLPGRRLPGQTLDATIPIGSPGALAPAADRAAIASGPLNTLPGEDDPGRRLPGRRLPGRRLPGQRLDAAAPTSAYATFGTSAAPAPAEERAAIGSTPLNKLPDSGDDPGRRLPGRRLPGRRLPGQRLD